ncbi:hypothetical protein B1A75_11265 [Geobacillus sp. LEMMY01]|nr:hypothetical protein B1A75_11265 [Geobacillus sp. LEMMY01]
MLVARKKTVFNSIATESFQQWVAWLCIGKSIQEVTQWLCIAYTTVERWFYQHAPVLLPESSPTVICVRL